MAVDGNVLLAEMMDAREEEELSGISGEEDQENALDEEFDELFAGIPSEPGAEISEEEMGIRRQRLLGVIAYISPVGALFALFFGARDRVVRFHGLQSLVLWIIVLGAAFLLGDSKLYENVNPAIQLFLGTAVYLFVILSIVAVIYCILGAMTHVPSSLPLIGTPLMYLCGFRVDAAEYETLEQDEDAAASAEDAPSKEEDSSFEDQAFAASEDTIPILSEDASGDAAAPGSPQPTGMASEEDTKEDAGMESPETPDTEAEDGKSDVVKKAADRAKGWARAAGMLGGQGQKASPGKKQKSSAQRTSKNKKKMKKKKRQNQKK